MNPVTIGIDEVGRGALAGPLVVCAVSLDGLHENFIAELLQDCGIKVLKDSKKLSPAQRECVYEMAKNRIIWSIGEVEPVEIDAHGLTKATCLAVERAIVKMRGRGIEPVRALVDAGITHPFEDVIETEKIVKGDEKVVEITLASIMAKVWRDRMMHDLHTQYPDYGFLTNVGYGTASHYIKIKEEGPTPIHRRLFLRSLDGIT